jgi:alkylhydroperoxidase/carboxymuconolactone decarboxylase family protein YurZ
MALITNEYQNVPRILIVEDEPFIAENLQEMLSIFGYEQTEIANSASVSGVTTDQVTSFDVTIRILRSSYLDLISKELILLCLLTYTQEANGRIHISRAKEAGVTETQMTSAISLAGAFSAFNSYNFLSENWSKEVRITKVLDSYLRGVEQSRGELDHKLCEIMGIACHASKRSFKGMQLHLKRAFSLKAKVSEVSEALSYLIMVSSVPTLTDAVLEWSEMANKGLCPPPFTDLDSQRR